MDAQHHSVSELLARYGDGTAGVEEELYARLHGDLRNVALGALGRVGRQASLEPTEVIHEAWLRITDRDGVRFDDRRRFFAFASKIMRGLLVDHARAAATLKRDEPGERVTLSGSWAAREGGAVDLLDLEDALARLERADEESARIVEMRFFGGMTQGEIADEIGRSERHVERRWRFARAWLRGELEKGD